MSRSQIRNKVITKPNQVMNVITPYIEDIHMNVLQIYDILAADLLQSIITILTCKQSNVLAIVIGYLLFCRLYINTSLLSYVHKNFSTCTQECNVKQISRAYNHVFQFFEIYFPGLPERMVHYSSMILVAMSWISLGQAHSRFIIAQGTGPVFFV